MKKFFSIILILLLSCYCIACNKNNTRPQTSSASQSSFVSSVSSESVSSIDLTTSSSSLVSNVISENVSTSDSKTSSSSIQIEFSITIVNETGGTITANKEIANVGDNITLDIVFDNPGYYLISLKYNGQDITTAKSFIMPNSNVEITVVYGYNPHWTEEAW